MIKSIDPGRSAYLCCCI